METDERIDRTGPMCPMPILHLTMRIRTMGPGKVLVMDADDDDALTDVPAGCTRTGDEHVDHDCQGKVINCYARKAAP